jgi:hypothetical protein
MLALDKTREFYEGVLGVQRAVADTIKIKEGGRPRQNFLLNRAAEGALSCG